MNFMMRILWLPRACFSLIGLLWFVTTAFIWEWLFSRSYWRLVWAMPALLVGLVFGTALVQAAFPSYDRVLRDRYSTQAQQVLLSGDEDDLELYVCRLIELEDELDPWLEYALGRVAERRGNLARTRRLMNQIAPADRAGYGPAHFWLAKDLMTGADLSKSEIVEVIGHHLHQFLQHDQHNTECRALLGQLHLGAKQFGPAIKHLVHAIDDYPHLSLPLATAYFQRRDRDKGETAARLASEHFRSAVAAGAVGDTRFLWAEAETLLGNYGQVTEILKEGLDIDPGNERFRQAIAQAYLIWAESLRKRGASFDDQLSKLQHGLAHVPDHTGALTRLATMAMSDDSSAKKARQLLVHALDKVDLPPSVRLLLGTKAAEKGKYNLALAHLEAARKQGLETAETLNNLGWVLRRVEPPQLEKALEVLDRAVELAPRDAEIRETRGQILLQLGRWADAIADLEAALPKMNGRRQIHKSLEKAYRELGELDMADAHREIVRQLEEAAN